MENKLHYTYLSEEEKDNPVAFIVEFCTCECDLNGFREEVGDMIKSACSKKKFGNSDHYFFNYRQLLKFLEVGYIFFSEDLTFSLHQNEPVSGLDKIVFGTHFENIRPSCFRLLSPNELRDTNIFFRDFFAHQDINEWRLIFSQFVEYAYRLSTIDEVMEDGSEMVILREYTEKLIEVIYLIHHIHQTADNDESKKAVRTLKTFINDIK